MRAVKILALTTLLLAIAVTGLSLLIRPLWYDINDFLGTSFPVMPLLVVLAAGIGIWSARLLGRAAQPKRLWQTLFPLGLADVFFLALIYVFFSELGAETVMVWRNLGYALPYVLWFGAIVWALWRPPRSRNLRAALIAGLAISAAVWLALPFRVALTSRPAVFVQQDGVNVVWGTNMRAISWVEYGPDAGLGSSRGEQAYGLKVAGQGVQRVFLPVSLSGADLYLRANVEGLTSIFPIDAVQPGTARSDTLSVSLPGPGQPLNFVAFSDLHDQAGLYEKLARQIDWSEMDMAVYLGDLVNNLPDPRQFRRSVLDLTTGGLDLPRVFVRGNHETRAEAARSLDEWMLPPGGNFYYTFQAGDAFFIVLDSGETYADDHEEFSGLVDFTAYHATQAEWLDGVLASPDYAAAKYRIVLVHIPPTSDVTPGFAPIWERLTARNDIDLVMSGHTHRAGIFLPGDTGLPFTLTVCGGYPASSLAAVTVRIDSTGIDLGVVSMDGAVRTSARIEK